MNLSIVAARTKFGMKAPAVRVEVHLSPGFSRFNLVGLPEKAVNESRERVRSAIINSGFTFPNRRVTISLAPADLPKEGGGGLDLAIAIGILAASKQVNQRQLHNYEFMGELALSGEILPIRGIIPAIVAANAMDKSVFISKGNIGEASLLQKISCLPASRLIEVVAHLNRSRELNVLVPQSLADGLADREAALKLDTAALKLSDIKGQQKAKRALLIAAAGGHNILMSGPPGSGKTMLATRLPYLLPPLTDEEYLEVLCIHSLALKEFGEFGAANKNTPSLQLKQRPFRAPHHTATAASIVGGGSFPKPGEISLAHNGVLFLDELPEFTRNVLEVLRQPLESGMVTISRAAHQSTFPARFQLVAAMNPCPCGNLNNPYKECRCTPDKIAAYQGKLSAPWLDRIDMQVEVPLIKYEDAFISNNSTANETTDNDAAALMEHNQTKELVSKTRTKQIQRSGKINARLNAAETELHCSLSAASAASANAAEKSATSSALVLMKSAIEKMGLSMRGVHRCMRVARSIADLADAEHIGKEHLAEALSYRRDFDR